MDNFYYKINHIISIATKTSHTKRKKEQYRKRHPNLFRDF